jgi:DNA-binding NarL/FixJ family response regulator
MIESKIKYSEINFHPQKKEKKIHLELSLREKEVLRLMASGLSNKQIASMLFAEDGHELSLRTVQVHLRRMFGVLGASNRLNAVIIGIDRKIINLEELTRGWDKDSVSSLTKNEEEVLDAMLINGGKASSDKEIASYLSAPGDVIKPRTIRSRIEVIYSKLKPNRIQSTLLYMAAKEQQGKINYLYSPPLRDQAFLSSMVNFKR